MAQRATHVPGFSFAATYHVAKTSSDGVTARTPTSRQTQAKLTIQAGVHFATAAGDIVIVHAGTSKA
jgi:hypothetical protein